MYDILLVTGNKRAYNLREAFDSMLLATILDNAGINVEILSFSDLWDENYPEFCESFTKKIAESGCRLVVFQGYWFSFLAMLRIAKKLKKINSKIANLFFGAQVTNTGAELLENMPFIDYIYIGEIENKIVDIVNGIMYDNSALNNVHYLYFKGKRESNIEYDVAENVADVNVLPRINLKFVKVDYKQKENFRLPINVGRGCPYRCTFCSICISRGRRFRLRSTDKIIEDIKYYTEAGISKFAITHDSFFVNHEKIFELCEKIKQNNLNVKIYAGGRIDNVDNPLLDKMLECGFDQFDFGIETGSPDMQIKINKKLDLEKSFEKIKYLREKGAKIEGYFISGLPEETEKDLAQTINYMLDLRAIGAMATMGSCMFSTRSKLYDDYYENLEYDNTNFDTLKSVVGYGFEEEWILNHKSIFAYLYDLKTTLRQNYKYICIFYNVFLKNTNTLLYLRELFGRENVLEIYKVFLRSNNNLIGLSFEELRGLYKNPQKVISNVIEYLKENQYYNVIKGIFELETDINNIKTAQTIMKSYPLDYSAYKQKLTLDKLGKKSSNLLICHTGKQITINEL